MQSDTKRFAHGRIGSCLIRGLVGPRRVPFASPWTLVTMPLDPCGHTRWGDTVPMASAPTARGSRQRADMSLFRKIPGGGPGAGAARATSWDQRPTRMRDDRRPHVLEGGASLEVVGESFYQENLWQLAARPEAVEDLRRRAAAYRARLTPGLQHPDAPPALRDSEDETLVCVACGRTFHRPRVRGRKPMRCPECVSARGADSVERHI
jgi:hypothetical protein